VPWPVVVIFGVFVTTAIFAPVIAPYDPNEFDLAVKLRPPAWQEGGSTDHLLGTDSLGRDVLSRLIWGARISVTVALLAIASSLLVGVPLGLLAGYLGGWVDHAIMRFVDIMLCLPALLFAALIAAAFSPGLQTVIVVIALFSWMSYTRLIRGDILSLKERDYVQLAKVAGCSTPRILIRHILPQLINIIVILATLEIGGVIGFEATLSFLGFGVPPSNPTWGAMLSEGRNFLIDAPWLAFAPGVTIMLVILSCNLLGDWLRDTLDPRLRQS
jgi:peptide/nickel transport system permease protein